MSFKNNVDNYIFLISEICNVIGTLGDPKDSIDKIANHISHDQILCRIFPKLFENLSWKTRQKNPIYSPDQSRRIRDLINLIRYHIEIKDDGSEDNVCTAKYLLSLYRMSIICNQNYENKSICDEYMKMADFK